MKKEIKIAILGAGTVGGGTVKVLRDNAEVIEKRLGAGIVIKKILVRSLKKERSELKEFSLTDDFAEILRDEEISVVVELMGGVDPAKDYMLQALRAKKSVVTANKDAVAAFGKELFAAAEENGVDFLFEASVGGGIPIIAPLKTSLAANKITEIMGIVNGTTNYMLTKMSDDNADYAEVLSEAQRKGYAEADPTADVEGLDAARKAAILASIAFNTRVSLDDVFVEGITKITAADIDYAKELGFAVKLLAIGKNSPEYGIDVRVHPVFLPQSHPLAAVNGVFNAIFVRGDAIGKAMFYGPGAGAFPTASAVVSDIMEAARDHLTQNFGRLHCTCYESKKICPIEETVSSYYVRLLVSDKPGVLGTIATTFGHSEVSLKSVIQTRKASAGLAEIVAVTHAVKHKNILEALDNLRSLTTVKEVQNTIRVENTDE